jgi:hypothetical protein
MALQKAINGIQKFWSKDHKSKYGHAGIIIHPCGYTFEALWRVASQDLWEAYGSSKLLIARHDCMTRKTFWKGFNYIREQHAGDWYPFYRLIFHAFPPLAKLSMGKVVCSELAAKFLWHLEMFPYYNGCNPDDLNDHICWGVKEGMWSIIFEQEAQ